MPSIQNSNETLNYLDTIGSKDKSDIVLGNSLKAMYELAGFLIQTARDNMDKGGNTASGVTSESMRIKDLEESNGTYILPIEIASTYKFLNDGVKGTEGGTGKYQFKTSRPGKKMAGEILKWIKLRGLSGNVKKPISKNERKNKRLKKVLSEAKSREALSYAIASSIKKKGIKPTKFFTKAVSATQKEKKLKYAAAFKLDIIESINRN